MNVNEKIRNAAVLNYVFHFGVMLDFKHLSIVDSIILSDSLLYVLHFLGFPLPMSVLYQCGLAEFCGRA